MRNVCAQLALFLISEFTLGLPVPAQWGQAHLERRERLGELKKNLDLSQGQLEFEYNRYLGWPGQAPSYKIGQRLWEQIRDEYAATEGDSFSKAFLHLSSTAGLSRSGHLEARATAGC